MNEPHSETQQHVPSAPHTEQLQEVSPISKSSEAILNTDELLTAQEAEVARVEQLVAKVEEWARKPKFLQQFDRMILKVFANKDRNLERSIFAVAQDYFDTRAKFDRMGQRITNFNVPEKKRQQVISERYKAIQTRLEALIPIPKAAPGEVQPTLFHAVVAEQWNLSMEGLDVSQRETAIFDNFPKGDESWEDSTPVDYMIFRLSIIGVKDYSQPLTAQAVAKRLLEYTDFLKQDEVVMPTVLEVFADLNAALESLNWPQLELSNNKIIFLSQERFQQLFELDPLALAGYNRHIDALFVPVNTEDDATVIYTKETLYGILQHELVHMARNRNLGEQKLLQESFEEGLVNLIARLLLQARNYLNEETARTYPLETEVMATVMGKEATAAELLPLDKDAFKAHLQEKYSPVMGHGDLSRKLLMDLRIVRSAGEKIMYHGRRVAGEFKYQLEEMQAQWGIEISTIYPMLVEHYIQYAELAKKYGIGL